MLVAGTGRGIFRALSAGGNVRVAAAALGFSAPTVYRQRRLRPDFAARWREIIDGGRARGRSIVRHAGAPAAGGARAKRIRCVTQWSEETEALFLDLLAATCNVRLAAEEAGVGHTSVYRQRRLRADFAEKWEAALAQGYARLEMSLVKAAVDSLADAAFDPDRPIPKMSAEVALKVLQLHRAAVTGAGKRPGWSAPPKGIEQYRESVLRKVAAIKAARREAPSDPNPRAEAWARADEAGAEAGAAAARCETPG